MQSEVKRRTRDWGVARHGGVVALAGQMIGQKATAARQAALTVSDVTVATPTTSRLLLRQQQTSVLSARRRLSLTSST